MPKDKIEEQKENDAKELIQKTIREAQALKAQSERQNQIIQNYEDRQQLVKHAHKNKLLKKLTPKTKKTAFILKSVMSTLVIGLIIFCIFVPSIFGVNKTTTLFKENVGDVINVVKAVQFNTGRLLKTLTKIAIVIVVGFILKSIFSLAFRKSQRGKTISKLIASFIKYIVAIIIIWMILAAIGVNTKTLVASAGILALVIGLGAQSLISDIISGLFIIFENSYKIGDIVVIKGFRGTVTEIGLRTTSLIDWKGNVKIVNNADIKEITNMSEHLSIAISTIDIEYEQSIEKVEEIIKTNLDTIKDKIPNIVNGPFYGGVKELGDSGVRLVFFADTTEDFKIQVERDLNRELKILFDKNKVNIPFPQVVINEKK